MYYHNTGLTADKAKADLLAFLQKANLSRDTLETLKDKIMQNQMIPDIYWDSSQGCGCVKGTLFHIVTGETPDERFNSVEYKEYSGESHPYGEALSYQHGSYAGLISQALNWAQVCHVSPFEEWLQHDYVYSEENAQMLCSWIDDHIAGVSSK